MPSCTIGTVGGLAGSCVIGTVGGLPDKCTIGTVATAGMASEATHAFSNSSAKALTKG